MSTPNVGPNERKSRQEVLIQIEEDKQQVLDILHKLAVCEDKEGRQKLEARLIPVINQLFDTAAMIEQKLDLLIHATQLGRSQGIAGGETELNQSVIEELVADGRRPQEGQ